MVHCVHLLLEHELTLVQLFQRRLELRLELSALRLLLVLRFFEAEKPRLELLCVVDQLFATLLIVGALLFEKLLEVLLVGLALQGCFLQARLPRVDLFLQLNRCILINYFNLIIIIYRFINYIIIILLFCLQKCLRLAKKCFLVE